jgi:hypothetical protein
VRQEDDAARVIGITDVDFVLQPRNDLWKKEENQKRVKYKLKGRKETKRNTYWVRLEVIVVVKTKLLERVVALKEKSKKLIRTIGKNRKQKQVHTSVKSNDSPERVLQREVGSVLGAAISRADGRKEQVIIAITARLDVNRKTT